MVQTDSRAEAVPAAAISGAFQGMRADPSRRRDARCLCRIAGTLCAELCPKPCRKPDPALRAPWTTRLFALALAVLCAVSLIGLQPCQAFAATATIARDARLAGDHKRTRFIADLSKKVPISVFSLDDPYRVIIDMADVDFQMPPGIGNRPRGLITGFRYGLYARGKSRIVIDVSEPFLVDRSFVLSSQHGQPARLVVDLVPTDRTTFLERQRQATRAAPVPRRAASAAVKPVIVLDPGHGGIDPGTSAPDGVHEKTVVLAFAKDLRKELEATGKFKVLMTRTTDTYISLPARVAFAQDHHANLFLSIHADSFPRKIADPRGATIFTLSSKASDREAAEEAAKENASDKLTSIEASVASDEAISNILFDLTKRETENYSVFFAHSVLNHLEGKVRLHSDKPHSANFVVLRSIDVPSALLELGYLSDPKDEKLLTSPVWRKKAAADVAAAIESYFKTRPVQTAF